MSFFFLFQFVAACFWGLWAIDRELVFPVALDVFFPPWLNHIMHTSIVIFDVAEMLLIPMIFPSRRYAATGTAIVMVTYLVW